MILKPPLVTKGVNKLDWRGDLGSSFDAVPSQHVFEEFLLFRSCIDHIVGIVEINVVVDTTGAVFGKLLLDKKNSV